MIEISSANASETALPTGIGLPAEEGISALMRLGNPATSI
jgi:hypothetical protein